MPILYLSYVNCYFTNKTDIQRGRWNDQSDKSHCCWCSVVKLCLTLWDPMDCSTPGFSVLHDLQSLLKFMFIKSVMVSNHLIFCWPLLLLSLIFPSMRVFSNELAVCIRWPSIGASASASVLPVSFQGWLPLGLTTWSPCSCRNSQESSSALQFQNIIFSELSLLYSPALTSVHDYWKTTAFTIPL